ncbi:MAG: hypothetical protein JST00_16025 [Deltaproteobacteria bacterium]|nr:hypothetical protein [Deltaproteobacteria bacterium]
MNRFGWSIVLLASTLFVGCAATTGEDVSVGEGASTDAVRSDESVYIRFAGFERGRIVDLASRLSSRGWNVLDKERGGERENSVQGINEVRFFHPADAERAAALAKDVAPLGPERGLVVRDLSRSSVSRPRPGQLEILISTREIVRILFAGFERERVVDLASRLTAGGWNVIDAERGGERMGSMEGLNEVRFFHPDDARRAAALAAAATIDPRKALAVRDLSRSTYRKADTGHLEVWISE